jgi:hypothetical protein
MDSVKKTKTMSVVISDKTTTKGHRKRLEFVRRLEKQFGNEIDVFISGKVVLEDKKDAIEKYRYHIAIENSVCNDYWTEKLADAYLELTYPIYYGCPNLESYFPRESFTSIDVNNFEASARTIGSLLKNDVYDERLRALRVAKELVLDKYNLFALMAGQCLDNPGQRKELVTIKPELIPSRKELTKAVLRRMTTTIG